MMFGFGLLMMLLLVGLPILLVVLLLFGAQGFFQSQKFSTPAKQNQTPQYQAVLSSKMPAPLASRYCSHCGTGLHADWTHCPQCGAPIQ
jgi:membrane protease subunit (stomatin/prohibitin family)